MKYELADELIDLFYKKKKILRNCEDNLIKHSVEKMYTQYYTFFGTRD